MNVNTAKLKNDLAFIWRFSKDDFKNKFAGSVLDQPLCLDFVHGLPHEAQRRRAGIYLYPVYHGVGDAVLYSVPVHWHRGHPAKSVSPAYECGCFHQRPRQSEFGNHR